MQKKTKFIGLLSVALFFCVGLFSVGKINTAQASGAFNIRVQVNPKLNKRKQRLEKQLVKKAQSMIKKKRLSGTITIVHDGKLLAQVSSGWQDQANGKFNNADTQYLVGSVSKPVTAAMIGILVQEGKMKLTDPLSKYYPAITNGTKTTVKDLLNHRSGLIVSEKVEQQSYPNYDAYVENMAAHARIDPNRVGTWLYQSYNYNLLAGIVAQVSGMSYRNFLKKNIMDPMGITTWNQTETPSDDIAVNYRYKGGKFIKQPVESLYLNYGAGQLEIDGWSLYRLLHSFLEGDMFGTDVAGQLYTKPSNAKSTYYTAGFYHLKTQYEVGQETYHVHGVETGSETSITMGADGEDAVIVQSNATSYTKSKLNYYYDLPLYKILVN